MSEAAEPPKPSKRRKWLLRAGVVLAIFTGIWLRVLVDGRSELKTATKAQQEGDLVLAVMHYGRAARWRAPLASHDEQALAALKTLATQAELARDYELALAAHRERRRAILGTRTPFGVNHPEDLAEANQAIAGLMARDGYDAATAIDELSAPTPGPTPGTWFAALSFVGWLGALLVLMTRGIDQEGRWRRGVAARAGLASLVLLPVWMWLTARG